MKTFPINNDLGKLHAFEVIIPLSGRHGVSKVVSRIKNAKILKKPKFLSGFRGEDIFCEFELNEKKFTIEEPFGDNSRYLVSTNPPGHCEELELIEREFASD